MRAVIQRVTRARVSVGGEVIGQIGRGLLVFVGVNRDDGPDDAASFAAKVAALRIFEDDSGKTNLSIADIGPAGNAALLVVSQFTLYADARKGNRPSFDRAAPPEAARALYESFVEHLRAAGLRCETGRFQTMMEVELVNDGPFTILLDTEKIF